MSMLFYKVIVFFFANINAFLKRKWFLLGDNLFFLKEKGMRGTRFELA